jgi:hypothetical protein
MRQTLVFAFAAIVGLSACKKKSSDNPYDDWKSTTKHQW